MMLKGLQFVGIDDMGSDKVKKEKIAVSAEPVSGGGPPWPAGFSAHCREHQAQDPPQKNLLLAD